MVIKMKKNFIFLLFTLAFSANFTVYGMEPQTPPQSRKRDQSSGMPKPDDTPNIKRAKRLLSRLGSPERGVSLSKDIHCQILGASEALTKSSSPDSAKEHVAQRIWDVVNRPLEFPSNIAGSSNASISITPTKLSLASPGIAGATTFSPISKSTTPSSHSIAPSPVSPISPYDYSKAFLREYGKANSIKKALPMLFSQLQKQTDVPGILLDYEHIEQRHILTPSVIQQLSDKITNGETVLLSSSGIRLADIKEPIRNIDVFAAIFPHLDPDELHEELRVLKEKHQISSYATPEYQRILAKDPSKEYAVEYLMDSEAVVGKTAYPVHLIPWTSPILFEGRDLTSNQAISFGLNQITARNLAQSSIDSLKSGQIKEGYNPLRYETVNSFIIDVAPYLSNIGCFPVKRGLLIEIPKDQVSL